MIKLVAIDLDDTLLDSNKCISVENINAVSFLNSIGVKVVITTGRPYFRIIGFLKQLGLYNDNSYIITYNGSLISNSTNKETIKKVDFNNFDIKRITEFLMKINVHFNVYVNELIYSPEVIDFIKQQKVFEGIIFDICDINEIKKLEYAEKIIICDREEIVSSVRDKVIEELGNDYNVMRSTPIYLEILPKDANKGKALKYLMDYLGIKKEEAMAIGDEENDLSMYEYVKEKVAVDNANELLKRNASFVTHSQNESGVAFAINEIIKKES